MENKNVELEELENMGITEMYPEEEGALVVADDSNGVNPGKIFTGLLMVGTAIGAVVIIKNRDKIKAWNDARKAKKVAKKAEELEKLGYVVYLPSNENEFEDEDAIDDTEE